MDRVQFLAQIGAAKVRLDAGEAPFSDAQAVPADVTAAVSFLSGVCAGMRVRRGQILALPCADDLLPCF